MKVQDSQLAEVLGSEEAHSLQLIQHRLVMSRWNNMAVQEVVPIGLVAVGESSGAFQVGL